jgi:hypothetical protein
MYLLYVCACVCVSNVTYPPGQLQRVGGTVCGGATWQLACEIRIYIYDIPSWTFLFKVPSRLVTATAMGRWPNNFLACDRTHEHLRTRIAKWFVKECTYVSKAWLLLTTTNLTHLLQREQTACSPKRVLNKFSDLLGTWHRIRNIVPDLSYATIFTGTLMPFDADLLKHCTVLLIGLSEYVNFEESSLLQVNRLFRGTWRLHIRYVKGMEHH